MRERGNRPPGYGPDEAYESARTAREPKSRQGRRRSDERLLEQLSQELERDPYFDASEIEVECENGEVVLRGEVEDRRAKRAAEECVEDLPGVRDVRNELRVQSRDEGRQGDRDFAPRHSADPNEAVPQDRWARGDSRSTS